MDPGRSLEQGARKCASILICVTRCFYWSGLSMVLTFVNVTSGTHSSCVPHPSVTTVYLTANLGALRERYRRMGRALMAECV